MKDKLFSAPIPGQSLTGEPQKYPYERPPETVDPEEAIKMHIKRINKPEVIDNLLDVLEIGLPIKALTESILTNAVMNGIHTVDVSLIIAPVIHEQIKAIANEAGIEYKEGFETDDTARQQQERELLSFKVQKALEKTPKAERDEGYDLVSAIPQDIVAPAQEQQTEVPEQAEPMMAKPAMDMGKGLMSRGA